MSWLLDVVPPDYRLHGVLAASIRIALGGAGPPSPGRLRGGRPPGLAAAPRAELGKDLPPSGLTAVLAAYQAEGRRLVATARAAELVSRALRGETFVPRLAGSREAISRLRSAPLGTR